MLVLVAGTVATASPGDAPVVQAMSLAIAVGVGAHAWWVLEAGPAADREAMLWLVVSAVSTGLLFGHAVFLVQHTAGLVLGLLLFSLVGPAAAVGVTRPRVLDVRWLIVQVVVVGVALVSYIAVFVGVVAVFQWRGHTPAIGVLAVIGALAATTFHPLRVVLRGVVDELLFGERPDPLDAATRVADRIGDDPVLALRAIREALLLPYASLWADGAELAASGTVVTHTRRLPLSLEGDAVGEMVVGLRVGDLGLSDGDEHVLRIVAPLLAQTLRARALATDLQESRGQAIATIEEERRRLRRDLHDGLGPALSGIAFTADAARNTLRTEPEQADELLRSLRADTVSAIDEIRRLVYGMRPPALDELGLVPALRQRATTLRTASGQPMAVSVEALDGTAPLPAAVEVAAYRIVTEALTNTARHSGSDTAVVRIEADPDCLRVEVRDAGATGPAWVPGVGMASMRERAAEVGGSLVAATTPGGGVVTARLPLRS